MSEGDRENPEEVLGKARLSTEERIDNAVDELSERSRTRREMVETMTRDVTGAIKEGFASLREELKDERKNERNQE